MAENFYTILTATGKAKLANSAVLGSKVNFKTLKVGDGKGAYYEPSESQTSLVNEVWSGNVGSISVDENNPNWIVAETLIPATIGGFFIREAGIFDEAGDLIAISKLSETYKPVVSEGSIKDLCIKIVLEVSNVESVTLKIDPTVIVATRKDIQVLESKIASINEELYTPIYSETITTDKEVNDINVDGNKQVMVNVEGKTIVNLFGADGDCEDISKWSNWNATLELSSNNKVFSNNSIKITQGNISGSFNCSMYKVVDNIIDKTKYYCLSAYLKNCNANSIQLLAWKNDGANGSKFGDKVYDTSKFVKTFIKIQPSDYDDTRSTFGIQVNGLQNQYGYVDGIMLEEITKEQYDDINFKPSFYVSGDMSVGESETRIKIIGKNLFNINKLTHYDSINLFKINDNTLKVGTKGVSERACFVQDISVLEETEYTLQFERDLGALIHIYGYVDCTCPYLDNTQNILVCDDLSASKTELDTDCILYEHNNYKVNIKFNTKSYNKIKFFVFNDYNNSNYPEATFRNIQLEKGSLATTFQPYSDTCIEIKHALRGFPSGVKDEIVDGKSIKRIEKIILGGDKNWSMNSSWSGFKRVGLLVNNFLYSGLLDGTGIDGNILLRYDNKKLYDRGNLIYTKCKTEGLEFWSNGYIYIDLPNALTGWGDNYSPTTDEIKAYFYGWRMGIGETWDEKGYNGVGTKAWGRFDSNGRLITGSGTSNLPTTMAIGYTPYRLYYQLETPTIIELNYPNLIACPEGNLIMDSDKQSWIIPKITYKIADNQKANIDNVMNVLSKTTLQLLKNTENISQISNPSLLINDCFQVWQRGSTFNSVANRTYTADRWVIYNYSVGSIVSKKNKGISIDNINGTCSICLDQFIEKSIKGKIVTFSVKTMEGRLYTISGIINKSGDTLKCNTDFGCICIAQDDMANSYDFVQIQIFKGKSVDVEYAKLEIGNKATPFIPTNYGEELVLCQRYYEKSYNVDVNAGTAGGVAWGGALAYASYVANGTNRQSTIFSVSKRTIPTITMYNPGSGMIGKIYIQGADGNYSLCDVGLQGFSYYPSSTYAAGNDIRAHFVADAEIY